MSFKRIGGLLACALVLAAMMAAVHVAKAEILGDYVSVQACTECHEEHVEAWKKTPHGNAWETLKEQGEEKQSVPGCVKCHVVAYEKDGGFIDLDLTPELVNVQCENCHGPGKKHTETQDAADIIAKPDEASCRTCHTEGQDKNFNYDKKSKMVHPLDI